MKERQRRVTPYIRVLLFPSLICFQLANICDSHM